MKLEGRDLRLARIGLQHLVAEAHNMIVTCPDPEAYAEELKAFEDYLAEAEALLAKVDDAINKEQG